MRRSFGELDNVGTTVLVFRSSSYRFHTYDMSNLEHNKMFAPFATRRTPPVRRSNDVAPPMCGGYLLPNIHAVASAAALPLSPLRSSRFDPAPCQIPARILAPPAANLTDCRCTRRRNHHCSTSGARYVSAVPPICLCTWVDIQHEVFGALLVRHDSLFHDQDATHSD